MWEQLSFPNRTPLIHRDWSDRASSDVRLLYTPPLLLQEVALGRTADLIQVSITWMGLSRQVWLTLDIDRIRNSIIPLERADSEHGYWNHSWFLDSILFFPWRRTIRLFLDVLFSNRILYSRREKHSFFPKMVRKLHQQCQILSKSMDLHKIWELTRLVLPSNWSWISFPHLIRDARRARKANHSMHWKATFQDL